MKPEILEEGPPYVYRFRSNNKFTIDELSKGYIYFANRKQLNDPYDSSSNLLEFTQDKKEIGIFYDMMLNYVTDNQTREYLKKKVEEDPNHLINFAKEKSDDFLSQFGIACFSHSLLNLMLWTHYSNDYKGICLKFNTDFDKELFANLRQMEYIQEFEPIEFKPASNPNDYVNLFYKKLSLWSNEYELRVLKRKFGKYQFKKEALKSVVLGIKISDSFKKKVTRIIKNKYPNTKIYQSKLINKGCGLSLFEIV